MQGEDFYTVEQAARALKLTPDRIRQMLRDGELEGVPLQKGGVSGWMIPVWVIRDRDRPPPPVDRPRSSTTGPESSRSGPEDISGSQDTHKEDEPDSTSVQSQRDDGAEKSREPAAPPSHQVSVQEAARILETNAESLLLETKDEVIADLRDRVAFLERQLEDRVEEIRRRDHIIAALTERIPPAIEAPDHERPKKARESSAEEQTRVNRPSGAAGPREEGSLRPWWRRAFRR
jgi:hypothetical protein